MEQEITITNHSSKELISKRPFDQLMHVPEEYIWHVNFFKTTTNRTYQTALKQFCDFLQLKSKEELRKVNPAHVTAFRNHLMNKRQLRLLLIPS